VTRFVVQIALALTLVIAPFMGVAIELTLQQPSTQSEETHEDAEHKKLETRDEHSTPDRPEPRRTEVVVAYVVPRHRSWTPTPAPTIDPAKFSERRLR